MRRPLLARYFNLTMNRQPIEHAYQFCPRCGTRQDDAGTIPFRCGECGLTQFFGPVAAVGGLIVNADGQLLMVRRARDPGKGKWGLPGGFVDRNETIEDALAREVLEETNLIIANATYLMSRPNDYVYHGVESPVIDLFYVCKVESTEPFRLDLEELEYHEWTRPGRAHLDAMAFESNRIAIQAWLDQTK